MVTSWWGWQLSEFTTFPPCVLFTKGRRIWLSDLCPFTGFAIIFVLQLFPQKFGTFISFFYLCTIACMSLGAKAGGLIYEKDVFERLSL